MLRTKAARAGDDAGTLRVLLLSPVYPPARGGIETLSGEIARNLAADVRVVALAPDEQAPPSTTFEPGRNGATRVVRLRNRPRAGRRAIAVLNARAVAEGLRRRPDVILVMHVKASPAARILSLLWRVPQVQYVHAKEMLETPDLASFAVQRASAVVCVSGYSRDLAIAAAADPERCTIIPNGVGPASGQQVDRAETPTLVTVSRLEDRYKGHDVVIRAMPAIVSAVAGVRWVIVGDGTLRPELERAVRDAGLTVQVEFAGAVPDEERDRLLGRAWVFVMPTRVPPGGAGEGFGIVYLEANAHGLPVVAGEVPGVVDAVLHGRTGLLVDSTDPDAVAAAVVRLLEDRELAATLGAGGRRRAQELAWPNVVEDLELQLRDVAAQRFRRCGVARATRGWSWLGDLLRAPQPSGPSR
ncbi:MAG TPA: glycosyltransferase family 4 protein [Solirubrobacteraceae bacterium]|nr:glycosyltransferase family 4 protein [Solirubrobacteraceae bacterium]